MRVFARRSVSRVLSRPLDRPLGGDGHSSGTFVAERLARPTRATARKARPAAQAEATAACRSYLVLLPVGFTLPPPLPAARCALTAPFHPYRPPPKGGPGLAVCFCGTFPGVAPAGRYPAPCLRGARTFLPPPRRLTGAKSGHPTVWLGSFGTPRHFCQTRISERRLITLPFAAPAR